MSRQCPPHPSRRATHARRNPEVLLLILWLCAALWGGCGRIAHAQPQSFPPAPGAEPAVAAAAPQRCVVDVYGDSIVAGTSLPDRPLAALMRRYPSLTLVDHAVPMVLLTELAHRFDASPRTGRWVVIENGVIDAWRHVNPAAFVQALRGTIERVRAEGREVVLTGFSRQVEAPALHIRKEQLTRRDQYDLLVRRLAEVMKVPFVDWGAVRFDGAGDLSDGVHPHLAYSNRLHDRLGATLDAVTGCR